jgi:ribosomal protein L40E
MSTDMSASTVSEHDLTLAIPGDVASVRTRLIDAIQHLGYKVLGEQPIYAKRSAQASGRWDCSLNVLDYPTILNVSLKQVNDVSVVATFNYEVKSYMRMTRGDQQTLAREAEAIAALATERLASSVCRACGTQITDESHFCRRCGAPLVLDVPELEVLRLTKKARNSYHSIFVGVFTLILGIVGISLAILLGGFRLSPVLWIGVGLAAYAMYLLAQGTWQLHYALNPKSSPKAVTAEAQSALKPPVTTALPPASFRDSVTEGTTELLGQTRARREKDTAELDTNRLM